MSRARSLEIDACDVRRQYIAPEGHAPPQALPDHLRNALIREFEDDIRKTQVPTGLDLSDWLSDDYTEPMRRPEYPGKINPV
jgi:hypothetical protein